MAKQRHKKLEKKANLTTESSPKKKNKTIDKGNNGVNLTTKNNGATANSQTFPLCLLKSRDTAQTFSAEPLIPSAVFIARHALSSGECQAWIKYAEDVEGWEPVSHPATKWIAHRECGRIQKTDWNMSHRLYQRIESVVQQISPLVEIFDKAAINKPKNSRRSKSSAFERGINSKSGLQGAFDKDGCDVNKVRYQPVSCNGNLRLYKYTKGQWFGRHFDEANKIDYCPALTNAGASVAGAQTEMTVLFYLSSCRGGATRFYPPHGCGNDGREGVAFVPEEGAVLIHVHGDHCLEHEAEPVVDGVKYVLRTDIVYGIM